MYAWSFCWDYIKTLLFSSNSSKHFWVIFLPKYFCSLWPCYWNVFIEQKKERCVPVTKNILWSSLCSTVVNRSPYWKRRSWHRHTQRNNTVRTWVGDSHLHSKERGLRRDQPCPHLGMTPASRTGDIDYYLGCHGVGLYYDSLNKLICLAIRMETQTRVREIRAHLKHPLCAPGSRWHAGNR